MSTSRIDEEKRAEQHRPKIHITIDGKQFATRDDDQEAASLLRLAARDPNLYNLARLVPGGDPDEVKDGNVLDLKDGDAFISIKQRVKISFTVDGVTFTTRDDDQEAAAILRGASLDPAEYDLARIKEGAEPKVFKDTKIVDLHDGDVFVSVKQNSPVA